MSDTPVAAIAATSAEWVDVSDAATLLGFDSAVILRLIAEGALPAMQVRGRSGQRIAHRLPRDLVNGARRIVFAGGQVELREYARQWAARNADPNEAVA